MLRYPLFLHSRIFRPQGHFTLAIALNVVLFVVCLTVGGLLVLRAYNKNSGSIKTMFSTLKRTTCRVNIDIANASTNRICSHSLTFITQ